jgi:hypothetical protein
VVSTLRRRLAVKAAEPVLNRDRPSAKVEDRCETKSNNVTSYTLADDPYAGLAGDDDLRAAMITPEQVATEIADAAEKPELSLRIPIGDPARAVLAARHAAPDNVPFVPIAG